MPEIYAKVSEMSRPLPLARPRVATHSDEAKDCLSVFNAAKAGQR